MLKIFFNKISFTFIIKLRYLMIIKVVANILAVTVQYEKTTITLRIHSVMSNISIWNFK